MKNDEARHEAGIAAINILTVDVVANAPAGPDIAAGKMIVNMGFERLAIVSDSHRIRVGSALSRAAPR